MGKLEGSQASTGGEEGSGRYASVTDLCSRLITGTGGESNGALNISFISEECIHEERGIIYILQMLGVNGHG